MTGRAARPWAGLSRGVAACIGLLALAGLPLPASALLDEFAEGRITSVERAEAALAASANERGLLEARSARQRAACHQKFLAERCLSEVRQATHADTQRIHAVELAAKDFLRRDEARQRELRLEKRRADEAASAGERAGVQAARRAVQESKLESKRRQNESFARQADERAARAARHAEEMRKREAARTRRAAEERSQTSERAQRARRHEARVEEALDRASRREAQELAKARSKEAGQSN